MKKLFIALRLQCISQAMAHHVLIFEINAC